jgi:hypothetical protein
VAAAGQGIGAEINGRFLAAALCASDAAGAAGFAGESSPETL